MTGLAFGGNKLREFEFSIAPALEERCDILLNSAASQSNQSCQTAAAACRLGLRSVIIARRDVYATPVQGNLLLCRLLGAEVHLVEPDEQEEYKSRLIRDLRSAGHRTYDTGYDGAVYRSIAYVEGFLELWRQLSIREMKPTALCLCSGDHAHVGLTVGAKALGVNVRIVGIPYSVRRTDRESASRLKDRVEEAARVLDLDIDFAPDDFETHVGFAGDAYGKLTSQAGDALRTAAHTEGLILDPVYTGKAMAGMIAHIRDGQYTKNDVVVFLHTGGTPAIFAYSREVEAVSAIRSPSTRCSSRSTRQASGNVQSTIYTSRPT